MPRVTPDMTACDRRLRNEATPEERLLWARLRHARPRFTRQFPIGRYIIDFACRNAKLAVELDGSQHLNAADYDEQRTNFLQGLGWTVLRFWNGDVRDNVEGVAAAILTNVALRLDEPTPAPSLSGRGDSEFGTGG